MKKSNSVSHIIKLNGLSNKSNEESTALLKAMEYTAKFLDKKNITPRVDAVQKFKGHEIRKEQEKRCR
jgi:hypothetical protein